MIDVLAAPQNNIIIVNHSQYGEPHGQLCIKYSIFSINEDFSCALVNEITTDASNVAHSGLVGRLTSPKVGTFLSVWGDLCNNSYFTFQKLLLSDKTANFFEIVDTHNLEGDCVPLGFFNLDDLYFMGSDAVYTSRAFTPTRAHPNVIELQVYMTGPSRATVPYPIFQRFVILPFLLTPKRELKEFDSKILQYKLVTDNEGTSERFLVQVVVTRTDANSKRYSSFIVFLLKVPTNEVLDMWAPEGMNEGACCIAHDSRIIAHPVYPQGRVSFKDIRSMNDTLTGGVAAVKSAGDTATATAVSI